eukprot:334022_1
MEQLTAKISEEDKRLLIKICDNIINDPNDDKYRNLNRKTILGRLSSSAFNLLFCVGFQTSGNRLILDQNNINKLHQLYSLLMTEKHPRDNTDQKSKDPINNGIQNIILKTAMDYFGAIRRKSDEMTNDLNDKQRTLLQLLHDGFELNETLNAIYVSTCYDNNEKKCVCGGNLKLYENAWSTLGSLVLCSLCKSGSRGQSFWICNKGNSKIHPYGFYVCDNCIFGNNNNAHSDIECICGYKMIFYEDALSIHGAGITCYTCKKTGQKGQGFWHCDKFMAHSRGYDVNVCDNCFKRKEQVELVYVPSSERASKNKIKTFQKSSSKFMSKALCICGESLSKDENPPLNASCNICGISVESGLKFIHCPKGYISLHPTGYYACNLCIEDDLFMASNNSNNITQQLCDLYCNNRKCTDWKRFLNVMKNDANEVALIDCEFIDAYLHLIQCHDTDEEFDFILMKLGECDVFRCKSIRRNYRQRNLTIMNDDTKAQIELESDVHTQILDKIHCYFYHSIDMGYRLSATEHKVENDSANMPKHIQKGHNLVQKLDIISNRNGKFNQLFPSETESKTDLTKLKYYSSGYLFDYRMDTEIPYEQQNKRKAMNKYRMISSQAKCVWSKHSSLKEEILQNERSVLWSQQLNNEMQKAGLYHNTLFRKKMHTTMAINHILVIMIYCNYDTFQFELSKTYRENNGRDHKHFYWFGKILKQAVQEHGYTRRESPVSTFYHGATIQLLFRYISLSKAGHVYIYGPFSTSSCFEIAVNFAVSNEGMVGAFQLPGNYFDMQHKDAFSCSWLSDFSNEKEHLFVQRSWPFVITGLIDVIMGHDYGLIYKSMRFIDRIIANNSLRTDPSKKETDISKDQQCLMGKIISSKVCCSSRSKTFESFGKYADIMINMYFNQKREFQIEYHDTHWTNNEQKLCGIFYKSIRLANFKNIFAMYPNVEKILLHIRNEIYPEMIYGLLTEWKTINTHKLKEVEISTPIKIYTWCVKNIDSKYWTVFEKITINLFMFMDLRKGITSKWKIVACSEMEFIINCFRQMKFGSVYFHHRQTLQKLVNLFHRELGINESKIDQDQAQFHKFCAQYYYLEINFEIMKLNPNKEIYSLFYDDKTEWLKLENLAKVFSKLQSIRVGRIKTSSIRFDNILELFSMKKYFKNLKCLYFHHYKGSNMDDASLQSITNKYQTMFSIIGWELLYIQENVCCLKRLANT